MLTLYYHPLASYCWKVLIALYEHGTPFERCVVDLGDADQRAALQALWPLGKFPVVRDGDRVVAESSIIVEYLDRRHPGPRPLVPADGDAALEARRWDRIFDSHVQTPVQEIVFDRLRGAHGDLERAYATLTTVYCSARSRRRGRTSSTIRSRARSRRGSDDRRAPTRGAPAPATSS